MIVVNKLVLKKEKSWALVPFLKNKAEHYLALVGFNELSIIILMPLLIFLFFFHYINLWKFGQQF